MNGNISKGKTLATFAPKGTIKNSNGEVRKYLSSDSLNPKSFKEIYFSTILPGKSKKWKCNRNQSQNLTSAAGRISVICIQTKGEKYIYEEFLLDDKQYYGVLEIPPGIIYGLFTDMQGAIVVNSLEENYSDADAQKITEIFNLEPELL